AKRLTHLDHTRVSTWGSHNAVVVAVSTTSPRRSIGWHTPCGTCLLHSDCRRDMATMTTQHSSFVNPLGQSTTVPRLRRTVASHDYVVLANANARGFRKAWKRGWFDTIPS